MPPSAIRKRPVSAMFESGPAAAPAAYERDAPWHAGLEPEKPQWTPRPHSQPFPEIKWGESPCQDTRVEWALAESVDQVGEHQCVV